MNSIERVNVRVDDISELFNRFDDMDISDDLAHYIENRCSRFSKNKMEIIINTNKNLGPLDKEKIVDSIRKHYGLETKYLYNDIKKMQLHNILYLVAGILIIVLESILPNQFIMVTIIDIFGWVIVWEAIFNLLFTDSELDRKLDRSRKISNCKIVFKVNE